MAVKTGKDAPEETNGGLLIPPEEGTVPFGGDCKSIEITDDVNVHQLMEEVYERLGDRAAYEVVAQARDFDAPISKDNPLTLYIKGDVDLRTVRGAADSHTKDDQFGLSEQERRRIELRERLRDGKDLTNKDLNELLRYVL